MRKIINGKKYDTETAELLLEFHQRKADQKSRTSQLYKKKSGEFFVREGLTFCVEKDDSWLRPCSVAEAMGLCEDYLSIEQYESIFGEVAE